jgi:hypothetical protein
MERVNRKLEEAFIFDTYVARPLAHMQTRQDVKHCHLIYRET